MEMEKRRKRRKPKDNWCYWAKTFNWNIFVAEVVFEVSGTLHVE